MSLNMKKWFISDTHFSHTNIIKYAGRPFANVQEMDQALIDNWNSCVGVDDQVFFLGDLGLGSVDHLQSICRQLKIWGQAWYLKSGVKSGVRLGIWVFDPLALCILRIL